jgi:hypothetical protein
MKNPPQPDGGQRHEYRIFCRAERVRKVTEDGRDYFECGECGRRAVLVAEDLSGRFRGSGFRCYVIEMHRGELEDR